MLTAVLQRAQAQGVLGARPIAEVLAHARGFVAALPDDAVSVVDLGSGAGIPGLVIALDRPTMRVTLVDRRASRVDTLQRAIIALGWAERVVAVESDAQVMSRDPAFQGTFDVVVARGFADPTTTLPIAARLARSGGWGSISEPPPDYGSRWDHDWVHSLGVGMPERRGPVVRFHVEH
jgi:16S rRNA (guanine527-N7)-methyltransferase